MKRLQKWFETMAGISQDENERLARAKAIFSDTGVDASAFSKPACWRRRSRVQNFGR